MQRKRFNHEKHLTLLLLTVCITQQLYADTDINIPPENMLPVLKYQATRTDTGFLDTSASVYRVDAPENTQSMGVNLSEVLKGVPGLQLNNRENYAQDLQISMRGFGARSTFGVRGIRLYVDGIPATMPDGQGQTSSIDLSSLSHLEVLGGPSSSLYGNSSGGTILATTKQGQGKDSLELGYAAGSHHKNRADLILQGGADRVGEPSYIISSSYFDTDGFRDHSEAEKVLSNAKLTWKTQNDSIINFIVNSVNIQANDPQGLTYEQWKENPKQAIADPKYNVRKEIDQTQLGIHLDKKLTDLQSLYAMAYYGQRHVTQYQSIPEAPQLDNRHAGGVIDFKRDFYGSDLRWTLKDALPGTQFIAGLTFDAMYEDRQGYNNFNSQHHFGMKGDLRRNETNTLWNLDPYLQASWQFLENLRVDGGLRYSNVHYESRDHYIKSDSNPEKNNNDDSGKTDYQKVLPSVAFNWSITPTLSSYISYAKGFETPTFTEMAYPAVGTSGINFALKPSVSDNFEFGVKSDTVYGDITAAVFSTETKDDIVSADANNGRNTFKNADKTKRQGFEFSWNKNLWHSLNASVSYSWLDAQFDAEIPGKTLDKTVRKGNKIPGVAENQAYFSLGWKPDTGLDAGFDLQYMDRIYVNDTNKESTPSFTAASVNAGYTWKEQDWKVRTFVRIDNLFDENYIGSVIVNDSNGRFYEPADGLNWSAGLRVTKEF
ncbi:TonB-dependent receptor [Acinetobacter sp. WCHAc010052]|uniref:TonB-dependent receptor n=1 Tax=Acinetobacter sp. WCHAc010052 TaxID=2004647 RepID=UPI000B3CE822|nr:TonB-dependent receptor [Acinetobacter sp. WCHAc010052]AXY60132.1 TonB-dependent receptor [Acinetobacter sp. WCHAc010052]